MHLTQLTTLKTRLGIAESDVRDDEILGNALAAVGARFEAECHRRFERSAAATYQFRADERDILVDRPPIESVTSFHLKENETTGWVLQSDIVYLIGPQANLIELSIALGTREQIAKVTFAGGYVLPGTTPGAGQTALPSDLEHAAQEQTVYWFQNRERLGLSNVSAEGGSLSQFGSLNLLPSVAAVLKKYERWLM